MNIVNAGTKYMVYGEDINTYKTLPANVYQVSFSKMAGFSLVKHENLTVKEKTYGPYIKKVQKVLHTFHAFDRNMGVILSGQKGVGKSMFARLLAEQSVKEGVPVIIVSDAIGGIADFISSIQQECVVLFDEFEKTFRADESSGYDPQEDLLSLFDGTDNGKKLYVITCNRTEDLNKYLLNRPGRFHYHFVLGAPTKEEIEEYMSDNLNDDAKKYIDRIVYLSSVFTFTYDILRAISFDLNQGYDLAETLSDLNIEQDSMMSLNMRATFKNGIVAMTNEPRDIDILNLDRMNYMWLRINSDCIPKEFREYCNFIRIEFSMKDVSVCEHGYRIDQNKAIFRWEGDEYDCIDTDTESGRALKEAVSAFRDSFVLEEAVLEKSRFNYFGKDFVYKYMV